MERLKVKTISQYITQRKINWLGKMFRMDATRLPRSLLMAEAHQTRNDQNEQVITKTNTSTAKQKQPQSTPGFTRMDKTHTPSENREPTIIPDKEEDTPQISQPSTSMEWIRHLSKATPPITPPAMISMIMSSELNWETASRSRTCIIAKMKIISKNDICLTVTQKRSGTYKKSISLGGVVALIVQMGNKWLEKSTESIKQLPEGLSQGVRYLLSEAAGSAVKNAKESIIPLTAPTAVPWTCDRCEKKYTRNLKAAKAHAEADVCRKKSRSGPIFFVRPTKSITQKQSQASKWQTKWSDQVAQYAISHLCEHNSLHSLVSNPLCQNCFNIKDRLTITTKINAGATTTVATTTTIKTTTATTTSAAATTTTAATSSVDASTTTAATTTAAASTTSTPGTHLPCRACIFSCLAPIAIDDMDTWSKIFNGGKKSNRAHASGQVSWNTNIKNIFITEARKIYKSCTREGRALKGVKSLIADFEQQLTRHNGYTNIADYFQNFRVYNTRTPLFVVAVTPFLFDTKNKTSRSSNFSQVYPSSKTNSNDYLHLLKAFMTSTAKTKRTPTLSKRRWIVSALLHLLQSRDSILKELNANSFYALHTQASKVTAHSRPPNTQNTSHCLPQPNGDESLVMATTPLGPTPQLSPTMKTTSPFSSSACHNSMNDKHPPIIYTDGACQGNGTANARAGVGVFYGKNDPRNISTYLRGKRQTNNRAELTAIKLALEGILNISGKFACGSVQNTTRINKTPASTATRKNQVITIKSDSKYCEIGLKTHLKRWKDKGWLNSKNEPVANKDLWRQVDELNTSIALTEGIDVKVEWVRGHNNDPGNEAADKLAVDGIGKWKEDKSADIRNASTLVISQTKINTLNM